MSYFQRFLQLREFDDVMAQPLDAVNLTPNTTPGGIGNGMSYDFSIGGQNYDVKFFPTKVHGEDSILAKNGVNIVFHGPSYTNLTGLNKPMTVYRQVFLAIRKYIQQYSPDALVYYGATPEQDWMYNKFYERYLKNAFTQMNSEIYISNAYIEKVKNTDIELYNNIQDEIKSFNYNVFSQTLQGQKNAGRVLNTLIKKASKHIAKFRSDRFKVGFIDAISNSTGTVRVIHVEKSAQRDPSQPPQYYLRRTDSSSKRIVPFTPQDLANPEIKQEVEALQQLLRAEYKIEANLYMG